MIEGWARLGWDFGGFVRGGVGLTAGARLLLM
jgi:hypothetical protein